MANYTDELAIRLRAVTDDFSRGMANARASLEATAQSTKKLQTSMNEMASKIQIPMLGLVGAVGAFLKTSGDFEQWGISFETMLGSADKADALMNKLVEFSAKTPFNATEIVEYSKRLLAMGFDVEQIIPTMENLGNIAAGVGRDKLPQLVLAFGQVKAAGHLTGMELRQFTEAGVPLLAELGKEFGKTTAQVQEMVSNGEVGFNSVSKAIENLTHGTGRFANLMEKQSESFLGQLSNLKDNLVQVFRLMGDALLPIAKTINDALLYFTQTIRDMSPETLQLIARGIGLMATAFASLYIVDKVAVLVLGLISAFSELGAIATGITFILSPVGLVIAGISAAIGIFIYNLSQVIKEKAIFDDAMGKPLVFLASTSELKRSEGIIAKLKAQIDELKAHIKEYDEDVYKSKLDSLNKQLIAEKAFYTTQKAANDADAEQKKQKNKASVDDSQLTQDKLQTIAEKAFKSLNDSEDAYFNKIRASRDVDISEEIAYWEKKKSEGKSSKLVLALIEDELNKLKAKNREEDDKKEQASIKNRIDLAIDYFEKNGMLTAKYTDDHAISLAKILDKERGNKLSIQGNILEILNSKKELSDKTYDDAYKSLDKTLVAEGYTKDQISVIQKEIRELKKKELDKSYSDYQNYLSESFNIGFSMVTDLGKTLSEIGKKMFGSKDSGFLGEVNKSLTSIFQNGDKASMFGGLGSGLAGALGGLIGIGIDSIIGGLFGSSKYKTVQEYAEEAYSKMVDNTNKKLDEIGKQKTVFDAQLDYLNALKEGKGGNSVISNDYAGVLGVKSGISVDKAIGEIQGKKIDFLNNAANSILGDFKTTMTQLNSITGFLNGTGNVRDVQYTLMRGNQTERNADHIIADNIADLKKQGKITDDTSISDFEKLNGFNRKLIDSKGNPYYIDDVKQYIKYGAIQGEQMGLQRFVNNDANVNALKQAVDAIKTQNEIAKSAAEIASDNSRAVSDAAAKSINDAKKSLTDEISLIRDLSRTNGSDSKIGNSVSNATGLSSEMSNMNALDTLYSRLRSFYTPNTTEGLQGLNDIYSERTGLFSSKIGTLQNSLTDLVDREKISKINTEIQDLTARMKALPQFANGTMEIPRDMVAKIHKGEGVVTASIMESIRAGKLSLSGPQVSTDQGSSDNRVINIHINGSTKSGSQIYQEMAPYIGSVRKIDQGSFKGLFRG